MSEMQIMGIARLAFFESMLIWLCVILWRWK